LERGGFAVITYQGPDAKGVDVQSLQLAFSSALRAKPAPFASTDVSLTELDQKVTSDVVSLILPTRTPLATPLPSLKPTLLVQSQSRVYSLGGHTICLRNSNKPGVSLQGFSLGGASERDNPVDDACLMLAPDALRESGMGKLSGPELEAVENRYGGSRVYLQRHLLHRGLGGSCQPHKQADAFKVFLAMIEARLCHVDQVEIKEQAVERLLARHARSPEGLEAKMAAVIRKYVYGTEEALLQPIEKSVWNQVTSQKVHCVATDAFMSSAGPWTLCFVGALPQNDDWATELLHKLTAVPPRSPWMRGVRPRELHLCTAALQRPLREYVGAVEI